MSDLIDRQALLKQIDIDSDGEPGYYGDTWKFIDTIKSMPPTELSANLAEVGTDCISRQQAIDALRKMQTYKLFSGDDMLLIDQAGAKTELMMLPPAQPERIVHCKDCEWWTKQECSPQGRCALYGMYPTGGWFCGNARMREVTT